MEQFTDAIQIAGIFGAGKADHLGHPAGTSAWLKRLKRAKE